MPARYFSPRPSSLVMIQWEGNNLEEVRDFWEARGYDPQQFDVSGSDLVNPSGMNIPVGTFLIPMGGFGFMSEADVNASYQEVDNPSGMLYSIIEQM